MKRITCNESIEISLPPLTGKLLKWIPTATFQLSNTSLIYLVGRNYLVFRTPRQLSRGLEIQIENSDARLPLSELSKFQLVN
jgi:hypothetical protein